LNVVKYVNLCKMYILLVWYCN